MLISYNWLQSYFEKPLPSIEELDELLALHAFETEGIEKVGNDYVIDIDVLPNRAHDCLSHLGIAKEVAALLGDRELVERYKHDKEYQKSEIALSVDVHNKEQCRRYMGRVIENVKVTDTPNWIKNLLEAVGQRSINNIVDVTNFVMLDLGNPIHAFDLDRLASPQIIVRKAKTGEQLTTLGRDKVEVELDESILVIADEKDPLALAGIKGGKKAEVDEKTTNIVLELANFEPMSTRKTRQKTGIVTDSSKRFENELSPEIIPQIMDRLTLLILEVAGTNETKLGEIVDVYPSPVSDVRVVVSLSRINELLGLELQDADVADIFKRLSFDFTEKDGVFDVLVPSERLDLRLAEDLIEEVGRVYGYDKLPSMTVEDLPFEPELNKVVYFQNRARDILIDEGYSEVMTYSFQNKGEIEMVKAVASDKGALRTNLSKGLTEALEKNIYHAELFGDETVRVFEFGKVFGKRGEALHLALGVQNKTKKAKKANGIPKEQLTSIVEKINAELGVTLVAPRDDGVYEVNFEETIERVAVPLRYENLDVKVADSTFSPVSPYPFIIRDVALWVSEGVTSDKPLAIIKNNGGDLLVRTDLFDEFTKEGQTSYAYRLVFQSEEKTLSDDEVNTIMTKINDKLTSHGWTTR